MELIFFRMKDTMVHRHLILIAGLKFELHCCFEKTENYFRDFFIQEAGREENMVIPLAVSREQIREYAHTNRSTLAFSEYSLLMGQAADRMLGTGRCLFHGAAFCWNQKAYLFTAPSGTGKSTQLKNWIRLYKDEIQIIDGDKPVLRFFDDGSIMVSPSPWNGKERWRGDPHLAVPLAGIIYLRQGTENRIHKMTVKEAVLPIFSQFLFTARDKESVFHISGHEEQMLETVPVWELINLGDLESARVTRKELLRKEGCR